MNTYRFETLEAWQLARAFRIQVYELVKTFPPYEAFALSSQLRRAASSITANLAEGSGRVSSLDWI
ncbi:MAG: four helix bundle protein [Bacteroidia bacterium]